MQKLMLTLSLIFCFALCSAAATNNIERANCNQKISKSKNELSNSISECTVTASSTAHGEDCFGNPITVTGSCTSTAPTCTQAYSQAGACAYTVATLGIAQINDCP